jgi:hypothetical protein
VRNYNFAIKSLGLFVCPPHPEKEPASAAPRIRGSFLGREMPGKRFGHGACGCGANPMPDFCDCLVQGLAYG